MTRRSSAWGAAALALALVLAAPPGEAQSPRTWQRGVQPPLAAPPPPPPQGPPPAVRRAPPIPEYYLDRRGPVATPKAPMSGSDIAASLRARGFRDIAPAQQRGNTLIIPQATGPSGERVQLVIGPNGEIMGVRVLGPGRR